MTTKKIGISNTALGAIWFAMFLVQVLLGAFLYVFFQEELGLISILAPTLLFILGSIMFLFLGRAINKNAQETATEETTISSQSKKDQS